MRLSGAHTEKEEKRQTFQGGVKFLKLINFKKIIMLFFKQKQNKTKRKII